MAQLDITSYLLLLLVLHEESFSCIFPLSYRFHAKKVLVKTDRADINFPATYVPPFLDVLYRNLI